jgi:hypothetical protein
MTMRELAEWIMETRFMVDDGSGDGTIICMCPCHGHFRNSGVHEGRHVADCRDTDPEKCADIRLHEALSGERL